MLQPRDVVLENLSKEKDFKDSKAKELEVLKDNFFILLTLEYVSANTFFTLIF